MKKLFAALIVVALVLGSVFALVACQDNRSEQQKLIDEASKMSREELEAASKAEIEANPGAVFYADSLTSGVEKALKKFAAKYDWLTYGDSGTGNAFYRSRKGSEFQTILNGAAETDEYVGDFVMVQDQSFVNSLYEYGFLLSYLPSGSDYKIDKANQKPLVGVTFNKMWYYNSVLGEGYFQNVWQLTGKDGSTLKKIPSSFQSPMKEDINMNFLIMLTAPKYEKQLKDSYKSYFGKDYAKEDDCASIGFHYVEQFIAAVSNWHSSDTNEAKNINDAAHRAGGVYFAGLAKTKDFAGYKEDPSSDTYYTKVMRGSGWNYQVEGFNGFVYDMWTLIPKTAKLPYTACLFINYLLSEEGFAAGFEGVPGYYCSNTLIAPTDGTTLEGWKKTCLAEDPDYLDANYTSVKAFIIDAATKAGAPTA